MDLPPRDILKVDTRASPTPDGRTADIAFHGLDLYDRTTESRGTYATRQDDRVSTLKVFATSSPNSTTTDEPASSALAQAAKQSTLSGVAILPIVFGSIVAVVFLILALACWIRRAKSNNRRDHGLTQPIERPAKRVIRRSGEIQATKPSHIGGYGMVHWAQRMKGEPRMLALLQRRALSEA